MTRHPLDQVSLSRGLRLRRFLALERREIPRAIAAQRKPQTLDAGKRMVRFVQILRRAN